MNEIMKLMQGLSPKEKRAVRAYRILTHAFFCGSIHKEDSVRILFDLRCKVMRELKAYDRAARVAREIVDLCADKWMADAIKAGLR
jgi:RNA:NAD 2'-phosphotransferase (TPT1/KptA family)